jgi:hypothetical protein
MEDIKCHFCGRDTASPKNIGELGQCPNCGARYLADLSDDEGDTIYELACVISGNPYLSVEKIDDVMDYQVQREFDFMYEDKEQAEDFPEEGAEVIVVWARPRAG